MLLPKNAVSSAPSTSLSRKDLQEMGRANKRAAEVKTPQSVSKRTHVEELLSPIKEVASDVLKAFKDVTSNQDDSVDIKTKLIKQLQDEMTFLSAQLQCEPNNEELKAEIAIRRRRYFQLTSSRWNDGSAQLDLASSSLTF
jgi:hypothetical protein